MKIENIFLIVFCLAIVANAIALIRHWRMMRALDITLNNLIATQRHFNALMDNEQRRRKP